MYMHDIQTKLLNIIDKKKIGALTLREIGELIDEPEQPQKIKHHLLQLAKRGLIRIDKRRKSIEKMNGGMNRDSKIMSIPILGSANCGEATIFADEQVEGYLKMSKSLVHARSTALFAIRAVGNSMNRAKIGTPEDSIDDGDYVLVDNTHGKPKNGDYVLSTIDDVANIKKFMFDKKNNQIILISESSQHIPPIYIHPRDLSDYIVNGRVVQVIKKPSF